MVHKGSGYSSTLPAKVTIDAPPPKVRLPFSGVMILQGYSPQTSRMRRLKSSDTCMIFIVTRRVLRSLLAVCRPGVTARPRGFFSGRLSMRVRELTIVL